LIDENCDQIRHTISGLREARKATYLSVRLYLEAPGAAVSMREHLSKQTNTLNDLDLQIDDWLSKLDESTSRKQSIQTKLWQHTTCILAMQNLAGEASRISEEHTPPRSPERNTIGRIGSIAEAKEEAVEMEAVGREVESITIYADSGVASLLRSIEQELDDIDRSRHESESGMI
jgi:hypothetical protein